MNLRARQRSAFSYICVLLALGCSEASDRASDPLPAPVGPFLNGVLPSRTPSGPGSSEWDVEPAFPNITLTDTLVVTAAPTGDRIYAGSRNGLVVSFENDPGAAVAEPLLDIRDRVAVVWDGGFLGLVFHPEFGQSGSPFGRAFYVYYSSHCSLDASGSTTDLGACNDEYPRESASGFFGTYLRLSRFEALPGGLIADASSEQVMINIRLYNDSHRGGGLAFRDDGYLYVTIGDQFRFDTAQDVVDSLEGGTLRLAVDVADAGDGAWSCPAGSHAPRRVFDSLGEASGLYYCVPDDNPWLDPEGGLFEEYCSIGHRNPHRLARDPVTDRLWSGEIGEASREEINVIECGNNYGWPFREGKIAGVRPEPDSYLGELTDPVIDFTRDEAQAIIGGYVYRGAKLPELEGYYLAGDYVTNRIWAISLDESTMTATKTYLTDFSAGNLATWGQDNEGEVFMGSVVGDNPLYALTRIEDPVGDAPSLLSQTAAFADLQEAEPNDFWLPYSLNQPFWSDGAAKTRFIAVPSDGERDTVDEQIAFDPFDNWSFPVGTVLMKHFELPLDEVDPRQTARLETRFLVLGTDDQWYGLTYRWLEDQSDAVLLTAEETEDYEIVAADGSTRTQTWYFPSRLDCLSCHRQGSGGALGVRTHQLNGSPSDGVGNQLLAWNALGLFSESLDEGSISMMPASPSTGDVTAPLEERARSWLDSNCSYCHRPAEANAGFDARFTTPFPAQGLLWTGVRNDLGNPDTVVIYPGDPTLSAAWQRAAAVGSIAMPPLAKELPDQPAVDLLGAWIERVDPEQPETGLSFDYYELFGLEQLPDFDSLTPVSRGTVSRPDLSVREHDDHFAIRFSGYLAIELAGQYDFYTSSDDGSQLYVDDQLVVDNDGLHAVQKEGGTISLDAGYHPITITMFEADGGEILEVTWSGPDTVGTEVPLGPGALFVEIPSAEPNRAPLLQPLSDQRNRRGDEISLQLVATDDEQDRLYYDASGLPSGLDIDHELGLVRGTVEQTQTTTVTVSVSDGPEVSTARFEWSVAAD